MRLKLIIQYKGTNYNGWQVQPNGITIQGVLQDALAQILGEKINVIGSGRTDSGVHALAQVAHFDLPKPFDLTKLHYGLNSILPEDIAIVGLEEAAENFHAQLSAKRKIYEYFILNQKIRNPFLKDSSWHIPYPLDLKQMKKAAKILIGEHDFKAFCASDSNAKTTVRRIYKIKIEATCISIEGNGFLKHMVRNIVGTLVMVGLGKINSQEFEKILKSLDRRKAGRTAPAKGLRLKQVIY